MENVSYLRCSLILAAALLLLPAFAHADATLSVSPLTWAADTDVFTWTVGGTPNGSDYAECFPPSGTKTTGRLCPDFPQTNCMQAATTSKQSLASACQHAVAGTGTVHLVGMNVDAGTGFADWTTKCDTSNTSTYATCSTLSSRAGYFDISLTFLSPAATPVSFGNLFFFGWW